jgi:hypothetical protein
VIPTAFVTDKRYSSPFELLLVFANFSCESLQFSSYHYLFPNSRGGENRRLCLQLPSVLWFCRTRASSAKQIHLLACQGLTAFRLLDWKRQSASRPECGT